MSERVTALADILLRLPQFGDRNPEGPKSADEARDRNENRSSEAFVAARFIIAHLDALPATPPASETVEAAWEALIIELDEPQPGMTSWGSIQRHRPRIEAAIRAAALDEAREAIGRVVTYGRAVAKESYAAAIDALRERSE